MKLFSNILKTTLTIAAFTGFGFSLTACQTTPMSFGVPTKQFNKMTPKQRKAQIARYNAQQKQKAKDAPYWHALGALAGLAAAAHPVGTKHCHNQSLKPVCHNNPDGSRTCTASGSGSCSGFSID